MKPVHNHHVGTETASSPSSQSGQMQVVQSQQQQSASQQRPQERPAQRGLDTSGPGAGRVYDYKFFFHGSGLDLFLIVLKNQILAVLTLGIYYFWGTINLRKYVSKKTEFNGQGFEFTGTGGELFVGWLKLIGLYIVAVIGYFTVSTVGGGLASILGKTGMVLFSILFSLGTGFGYLFVIGYGHYAARRYMYSRTNWGQHPIGLQNAGKDFALLYAKGMILNFITLGIYYPIHANKVYRFKTNRTYVGNIQFRYTGSDNEMFSLFLKYLPIMIVTLGIGIFWYQAKVKVYRAQKTWIGSQGSGAARGSLKLSGGDLFQLALINILCLVFTFGLAFPWVMNHNMAFMLERFKFKGMVDLSNLTPVPVEGDALGDAFAGTMFIGFI